MRHFKSTYNLWATPNYDHKNIDNREKEGDTKSMEHTRLKFPFG